MTLNSPGLVTPDDLAVVVGASGGIGAGFVQTLSRQAPHSNILALSRTRPEDLPAQSRWQFIDTDDETSILKTSITAKSMNKPVRLVIVASGTLHNRMQMPPEKTWAAQERLTFESIFLTNTIGPALVAKHFLPLLDKGQRAVFAVLSARVGSISDNRLGGWHAYRASKAALNMLIQNYAVELHRKNPRAVCIGLHPGTVDTVLSKPFQKSVKPGGLFSSTVSVGHMLTVINHVTPEQSGQVLAWDGSVVPR